MFANLLFLIFEMSWFVAAIFFVAVVAGAPLLNDDLKETPDGPLSDARAENSPNPLAPISNLVGAGTSDRGAGTMIIGFILPAPRLNDLVSVGNNMGPFLQGFGTLFQG